MNQKSSYTKRLENMLDICIKELAAMGIEPAGRIFGIRENSRAKKRLGCCKMVSRSGKRGYELEVSSMLEHADDAALKDVVFHELLHTCRGCMNHGARWKSFAGQVNRLYGTNIKVRADEETDEMREARQTAYKYEISCTVCGAKNYRMRRSSIVDHPENYRCGRCGGGLRIRRL